MPTPLERIGLFAKPSPDSLPILQILITACQHVGVECTLEEATAAHYATQEPHAPSLPFEKLMNQIDALVIIGGDGFLIRGAQHALHSQTPIVGINRGQLGFLADIAPASLPQSFLALLRGEYFIEARSNLQTTLNGETLPPALNEIVITSGVDRHMLTFQVQINDQLICELRADGLMISTPTGSTAYALSAGGPIVHPELNAWLLLPMFAHTLSARPIVFSDKHPITISVAEHTHAKAILHVDSQHTVDIPPFSKLVLEKHPQMLPLMHPLDYDYYSTLQHKLGWHLGLRHLGI